MWLSHVAVGTALIALGIAFILGFALGFGSAQRERAQLKQRISEFKQRIRELETERRHLARLEKIDKAKMAITGATERVSSGATNIVDVAKTGLTGVRDRLDFFGIRRGGHANE